MTQSNRSVAIIGSRGYPSYYGGFETAVRKIAPFLAEKGWDVTVFGRKNATRANDPNRNELVRTIQTWGVDKKSVSTLSYGLTASLMAVHHKPQVALIMNVANGFFLPLFKLMRIPTVVNVDGIEWEREKWGHFAKTVFKSGAWFTAIFADYLIFDSTEIENRWNTEFKRAGHYVPYGGESHTSLPPVPLLADKSYVLMVARLVPENTIEEFFEAARAISKHKTVVIVGTSGYGGHLDNEAATLNKLPNIIWMGHISDELKLFSLWQHAAVYFHGHSVGGTNPSLVQAMTLGAPIVARDTPYNREVLGPTGNYCSPDSSSITEAILAVSEDQNLQTKISRLNIERAKSNFSWEKVTASYEEILDLAIIDRSK